MKNYTRHSLNRFEIIANRGIIARLSDTTSFGLYETVRNGRFFNFLAATQKFACYHFLYILTESEHYFQQNLGEKSPATMVNKQVFFSPKIRPQQSLFLEICNDSTKDGRLTMARVLSSSRPLVLGRIFKSGAITIELDEMKSWNFIHKCVVSSQYFETRMTISLLMVHELFASKN